MQIPCFFYQQNNNFIKQNHNNYNFTKP